MIIMLIKDFIKSLETFNPNAEISLVDSESIYLSYICEDGATPLTTKQVFIEGCDCCYHCQFFEEDYCRVYDKECVDVDECFQFIDKDEVDL